MEFYDDRQLAIAVAQKAIADSCSCLGTKSQLGIPSFHIQTAGVKDPSSVFQLDKEE